MTKLIQWLSVASALVIVWLSLLTNKVENMIVKNHYTLLLFAPVICIILFGFYALCVVLYRTFTFNNCEEAAIELKNEIEEARKSLSQLGYKPPAVN